MDAAVVNVRVLPRFDDRLAASKSLCFDARHSSSIHSLPLAVNGADACSNLDV